MARFPRIHRRCFPSATSLSLCVQPSHTSTGEHMICTSDMPTACQPKRHTQPRDIVGTRERTVAYRAVDDEVKFEGGGVNVGDGVLGCCHCKGETPLK